MADGFHPQWRRAFRRLPITLGVLLFVGLLVGGLVYVAAGPAGHRFQAAFTNNLQQTLDVGICVQSDCKNGGSVNIQRVESGKSLLENVQADSNVNAFVITTLTSQRVGCLFLRYKRVPRTSPVIPLSKAVRC